ncbi:MAG: hypothetical protein ABFS14_02150 [Gemmatimonadota bacterium]
MSPSSSPRRVGALAAVLFLVFADEARSQYAMTAPSGREISFSAEQVRTFLDSARALRADLEEDPRVLYMLDFGADAHAVEGLEDEPDTYPWDRVTVRDDSVAVVLTPGNLREGARAYYNYAVQRMRIVRATDPDVTCDELMRREVGVVSSFVEGWVVARTLFGGPEYRPLDELAFAREAGVLDGLIAARSDRHLGSCSATWAEAHADRLEAYERFHRIGFLGLEPVASESESESASG